MRSTLNLGAVLAAVLILSPSAAAAAKPNDGLDKSKPKAEAKGSLPPGIEKKLADALKAVGHGADKPEGNGHGYGHLLHEHEQPVSP